MKIAPPQNSGHFNQQLVKLLMEMAHGEGSIPTLLQGVRFMRAERHIPRVPIAYEPEIVIIAQGRKTGYWGEKRIVYDPHHYLVMSVPMAFECETAGTPAKPLLGLTIHVTPVAVTELLTQMELSEPPDNISPQAMQATPLDDALGWASVRLLECLKSGSDARILGPQMMREIIYRVLQGALGNNLRALAAPDTHFGRISRILNRIHTDYARNYKIPELAQDVGMSVSAFHACFKNITSFSPQQYVKNIRLHKSRMLMVNEGLNASEAALRVGYESTSQFTREFKRLFGNTPAMTAAQLRRGLVQF